MSNGKGSKKRKEKAKAIRENWGQVSGLNSFIPDWVKCPECKSRRIEVNNIQFDGETTTILQCCDCEECFEL